MFIEGGELSLKFSAEGDPKPTVRWLKDGKEIKKKSAKFSTKGVAVFVVTLVLLALVLY